ncbi:MAG TPA: hypothetical protein VN648_25950, partial [Candidatus Methylomirabilis sp.]|nr:hypothetical protein [Candidatus Methylomirabilis sp.]
RGPALMLGFGLIAAAPLLTKPRLHLLKRLETWFSERASQQNTAHLTLPLRNYKTAFVAASVLLLFLIGVLTPMALFQAAQRVERRLGIKQAQLHLASSLAERRKTMLQECEESDKADAACADFRNSQGMAWQFILPNLPSGSLKIEPHAAGNQTEKCKELYGGWLRTVLYLLRHSYNDVSAETRGIIADCSPANSGSDSPEWFWDERQSRVQLRWHGVRPAGEGPPEDLVVSSAVPDSSRSDLFTGAEVGAAVILLMGGLCWGLARKLFLFDVAPLRMTGARQAAEALREGRSILVIVPPRFADWQAAGTKCSLSAREASKTGPKWGETLDLDAIPKGTVVEIRHFEYGE